MEGVEGEVDGAAGGGHGFHAAGAAPLGAVAADGDQGLEGPEALCFDEFRVETLGCGPSASGVLAVLPWLPF